MLLDMKSFTRHCAKFECLAVVLKEDNIASGLHTVEKMENIAVSGVRGRCLVVCKNNPDCSASLVGLMCLDKLGYVKMINMPD